jgi:hypothetical protein
MPEARKTRKRINKQKGGLLGIPNLGIKSTTTKAYRGLHRAVGSESKGNSEEDIRKFTGYQATRFKFPNKKDSFYDEIGKYQIGEWDPNYKFITILGNVYFDQQQGYILNNNVIYKDRKVQEPYNKKYFFKISNFNNIPEEFKILNKINEAFKMYQEKTEQEQQNVEKSYQEFQNRLSELNNIYAFNMLISRMKLNEAIPNVAVAVPIDKGTIAEKPPAAGDDSQIQEIRKRMEEIRSKENHSQGDIDKLTELLTKMKKINGNNE